MKVKKEPFKREYSAGGVVFKKEAGKTFWLIFQPKVDESELWRKGRWQLPKGWIEAGETSQTAALRETKEEGGVEAEIVKKIGRITIFFHDEAKQKIAKEIVFYLMRWIADTQEGPDSETEKVLWLLFDQAKGKLTFKSEKEILIKARKILKEEESQIQLF
jgi:8-oxo-dGTP pyrophosphatase MutT (NUDIX family)